MRGSTTPMIPTVAVQPAGHSDHREIVVAAASNSRHQVAREAIAFAGSLVRNSQPVHFTCRNRPCAGALAGLPTPIQKGHLARSPTVGTQSDLRESLTSTKVTRSSSRSVVFRGSSGCTISHMRRPNSRTTMGDRENRSRFGSAGRPTRGHLPNRHSNDCTYSSNMVLRLNQDWSIAYDLCHVL